MLQLSSAIS